MLKEYQVGETVQVQGLGYANPVSIKITKRYSINPGGPLTYYVGHRAVGEPHEHEFHLSQVIPEPVTSQMTRESVLDQAKQIVMQDRNLDYGSPEKNSADIAALWSTYLGVEIKSHDVGAMMILMKISRIKTSPSKEDHWVDVAGYAAVGAEAYVAD